MFIVRSSTFDPALQISKPINVELVRDRASILYFDKDGFELTPLEQQYYRSSGIPLTNYLWNLAAQKPWIELEVTHPSVFLDHSMLLERYEFVGDVIDQLMEEALESPELWKLIATRRKWGIDFSVDYIADRFVTDVFHVEFDSQNLDQLLEIKDTVERIVVSTDWVDAGKMIRKCHETWRHLEGKEQQNWKARYFGFDAAEVLCKTV